MAHYLPFRSGLQSDEEAAIAAQDTVSAQSELAPVGPHWRAHETVSRFLMEQGEGPIVAEAFGAGPRRIAGAANVLGVGVGTSMPKSTEWTAEPGVPSLRVYLLEPMDETSLRHVLADEILVAEAHDQDMPIEPVVTGEIRAFPHTFRKRKAPGGISTGHVDISAGTLGCLARGRSGERRERVLILSNNHVLADTNQGTFGDAIIQPGDIDGGSVPGDQIAALERFVPIDFSGPNEVDCATGWADPELVRPELVYIANGELRFFSLAPTTHRAQNGDLVGKSGRTTQMTSGRVANTSATIRVRFGSRVAVFQNQIEITPLNVATGPFSKGGDSGSIVWTMDEARQPTGLLFAGGGSSTFANHIDAVLAALDVELLT